MAQKQRKPNRSLRLSSHSGPTPISIVLTYSPTSLRLDKFVYPLAPSLIYILSVSIPSRETDHAESPASTDGNLVEHRRDNRIVLEIEIRPRSIGVNLPWDSIRIPQTKSVKRSVTGNKKTLDFRLEIQGATTGTIRDSLCWTCTEREPQNLLTPRRLVDFTSRTDVIDLKNGKAEVTFRFLCLSTHHGPRDSEYR